MNGLECYNVHIYSCSYVYTTKVAIIYMYIVHCLSHIHFIPKNKIENKAESTIEDSKYCYYSVDSKKGNSNS